MGGLERDVTAAWTSAPCGERRLGVPPTRVPPGPHALGPARRCGRGQGWAFPRAAGGPTGAPHFQSADRGVLGSHPTRQVWGPAPPGTRTPGGRGPGRRGRPHPSLRTQAAAPGTRTLGALDPTRPGSVGRSGSPDTPSRRLAPAACRPRGQRHRGCFRPGRGAGSPVPRGRPPPPRGPRRPRPAPLTLSCPTSRRNRSRFPAGPGAAAEEAAAIRHRPAGGASRVL